ncbi:MAG: carboxylesterase, partial [Pseudomonadales bacterium]
MALDCVEIETGPDTTGTVIWMHGLGADAHDFEPIVPMFDLVAPVHFVFPNAPERPVTINGGTQMRVWYDIDPAAGPGSGDADIQTSTEQITELIDREVANGTPTERIVLAGFSQGGVIALQLGLSIDARLAGIMALSTYVHEPDHLIDRVSFAS